MNLTVNCCLCSEKLQIKLDVPDGWDHVYDDIEEEQFGFCPEHAAVKPFTDGQCVGCVGGWGECDMWSAFAFDGRSRTISDADYAALENGVCPRRTNGTFGVSNGVMEDIDLTDRAVVAGKAFANSIREYVQKYGRG